LGIGGRSTSSCSQLYAVACDLRIADESATLGMPIDRLGITLSEPFVKRLVALIGPSKTKDFVYTGRLVDASEALRWGLVESRLSWSTARRGSTKRRRTRPGNATSGFAPE
jgi:enoyl-CoA hydratase